MRQRTGNATEHTVGKQHKRINRNAQAKDNFAYREILSSTDDSELCHLLQEMLLAANDLSPRATMRGGGGLQSRPPETAITHKHPVSTSHQKESALYHGPQPDSHPHE